MNKRDIIRGLKADLKALQETKEIENYDYHRGRTDELRRLIKALQDPSGIKRYQGLLKIFPSGASNSDDSKADEQSKF